MRGKISYCPKKVLNTKIVPNVSFDPESSMTNYQIWRPYRRLLYIQTLHLHGRRLASIEYFVEKINKTLVEDKGKNPYLICQETVLPQAKIDFKLIEKW